MTRQIAIAVLASVVAAGWVYWLAAWICTRVFFGRLQSGARSVVSCKTESARQSPRVSILKPVKGADDYTHENFASFCRQEYANYEILFGVRDESDPAVALIHRLAMEFPQTPIEVFVSQESLINPKCAILARLADAAGGEILVISDDDIRVSPDYLDRVIMPLDDPAVGWVTCPYRAMSPCGFGANLEGLHMDVVFLPAVILAHRLGQRIGMGATMAVRRADLIRAGGFAAIADYLMDDYQLASIIACLGLRGCLSTCIVDSTLGRTPVARQWGRELRWSRGIRVTCPAKYWGLLVTYPSVWAVLLIVAWQFAAISLVIFALTLAMRWLIALDVRRAIHGRPGIHVAWVPLRDLLSFITWCGGAWGRTIEWRGRRFRLESDGQLKPFSASAASATWFGRAVRRLDLYLRRKQGIFEFDARPQCLLRLSFGIADQRISLSDGTEILPGDRVCDLHFFNEHLPPIGSQGTDLAWAKLLRRRLYGSMASLAAFSRQDRRFDGIKAVRSNLALIPRRSIDRQIRQLASRLHFDLIKNETASTRLHRLHELGEDILIWALIKAFNPGGLRRGKIKRVRHSFFISRDMLEKSYPPETCDDPGDDEAVEDLAALKG
ncbi:MAG TPA: bacteriohopanetetrol glucosamine biosynthesis glycosyltransferase HpnI [Tepidisphaeraceae bacterium]|jgi:ceramide glucosyltransferase|nr:bacteriohopanetetrol glucosamine biosynthesis glycosyltransferase HpnI [Tepidisphaeraceae bacterium]